MVNLPGMMLSEMVIFVLGLVILASAEKVVHPLIGMGMDVPNAWFSVAESTSAVSDSDQIYITLDNIGSVSSLEDDTAHYAAICVNSTTVTCFVDADKHDRQVFDFMSMAFTARLLVNRAVVNGAAGWKDVVNEKHLVVAVQPGSSVDRKIATDIDEHVRTAKLHVNSPFSGNIFGDLGNDVVLADTFESVSVVLAENLDEEVKMSCDDDDDDDDDACAMPMLPLPEIVLKRFSDKPGCGRFCADVDARVDSLGVDMKQINFDFHGTAVSGLVRLAVNDAEEMHKQHMDKMVHASDVDGATLMNAHSAAFADASHLLGELLAGSGVLLVLARGELTSRVTDALSGYTFDQRLSQTRACADFGEHSKEQFARMLARIGPESATQDELLELARSAVSEHIDNAAGKRTLAACPLRDDSFTVHVYSRVTDLISTNIIGLKETLLDVSTAQSRQYRMMLERAVESAPLLSHEELVLIHEQAIAACKNAFKQHFGRYMDRNDVETHRKAMLANILDLWDIIDRHNNDSIAETCQRHAQMIAKRYANYIDSIYEQVGRGVDITDTKNSMRDDATATYNGLIMKYRSNSECRTAGTTIASEIRRLHSEFRNTKDSSEFGRIVWGSERLFTTVVKQGGSLLGDMGALLQKHSIGILFGLIISALAYTGFVLTGRSKKQTVVAENNDDDDI